MKTVRWTICLIGLAVLLTVPSARAFAQFEVDPDHYETSNTEPMPQSRINVPGHVSEIHYKGNFTLPYSLRCNGSSLPPGEYAIAVDSEGRTVRVTLNRGGHRVSIEGIQRRRNQNHGRNVLVVESQGTAHQLSFIQVAQLDLVFSHALDIERPDNSKPRGRQELPLILADSQR